MQKVNSLKKRLKNGETIMGGWCDIPSAAAINIIATAGLDFLIIDMEHGPLGIETVNDMIRAVETESCVPLVRVPKNDESYILSVLDVDAHGIVIPHIESLTNAEYAIDSAKYFPEGKRGFSPFTRAGRYSLHNVPNHSRQQNQETLIVLMIEGKEGVDQLADIVKNERVRNNVDVGAYDLSQAVGFPGQVDHPIVKEKLVECMKIINDAGIAAGGYVAKNQSDIEWMMSIGMRFITILPDVAILYHAYEKYVEQFRTVKNKR
jgi:4-hydroxy-2-oxoheptanedioate aldolase